MNHPCANTDSVVQFCKQRAENPTDYVLDNSVATKKTPNADANSQTHTSNAYLHRKSMKKCSRGTQKCVLCERQVA